MKVQKVRRMEGFDLLCQEYCNLKIVVLIQEKTKAIRSSKNCVQRRKDSPETTKKREEEKDKNKKRDLI